MPYLYVALHAYVISALKFENIAVWAEKMANVPAPEMRCSNEALSCEGGNK